ncbi:MAG: histidinol dehydrogenase, partial [Rheinheimera sp.]|nr:histidinol dehydrogenase [Rheinheimera sp.]
MSAIPEQANNIVNWAQLSRSEQKTVLARPMLSDSVSLRSQVAAIIDTVRAQGDTALRAYSRQFDALDSNPLALSAKVKQAQLNKLLPERKAAIELAYDNIRKFHAAQLPRDI